MKFLALGSTLIHLLKNSLKVQPRYKIDRVKKSSWQSDTISKNILVSKTAQGWYYAAQLVKVSITRVAKYQQQIKYIPLVQTTSIPLQLPSL